MKVKFVQSGGFTGLTRAMEIDSSSLPEAEAKSLAGLQELHQTGQLADTPPRSTPDAQSYQLELTDPERTLRLQFNDSTVPDAARPLFQFLRRTARPVDPREKP